MDQEKIGKFIAELRKEKNMTQNELAESLGITDRAISKWENGRGMPDLSLLTPLCEKLGVSINELLSGERLDKKDYQEKLEENFINTIDYIDKKNVKSNTIKSIIWLVIGIIGIILSQFLFNDYEVQNYLNIVSMVLVIYSIKQLCMRYMLARKIMAILLIVVCILALILNM